MADDSFFDFLKDEAPADASEASIAVEEAANEPAAEEPPRAGQAEAALEEEKPAPEAGTRDESPLPERAVPSMRERITWFFGGEPSNGAETNSAETNGTAAPSEEDAHDELDALFGAADEAALEEEASMLEEDDAPDQKDSVVQEDEAAGALDALFGDAEEDEAVREEAAAPPLEEDSDDGELDALFSASDGEDFPEEMDSAGPDAPATEPHDAPPAPRTARSDEPVWEEPPAREEAPTPPAVPDTAPPADAPSRPFGAEAETVTDDELDTLFSTVAEDDSAESLAQEASSPADDAPGSAPATAMRPALEDRHAEPSRRTWTPPALARLDAAAQAAARAASPRLARAAQTLQEESPEKEVPADEAPVPIDEAPAQPDEALPESSSTAEGMQEPGGDGHGSSDARLSWLVDFMGEESTPGASEEGAALQPPRALPTARMPGAPPQEDDEAQDNGDTLRQDLLSGDGYLEELPDASHDSASLVAGQNTPLLADPSTEGQHGAPPKPSTSTEEEESTPEKEESLSEDLEAIKQRDRVVAFLLREGIVTPEQVHAAQQRKEEKGLKAALWRVLAAGQGVNREAVYAGAARVYAFPVADLEAHEPNVDFTRQVMETFSEEQREELMTLGAVPLRAVREKQRDTIKLFFITHDPARPAVHRLLRDLSIEHFSLQYAPESTITALLAEAFPKKNEYLERMEEGGSAFDLGASYEEQDSLVDEEQLEAEISRSKLINLFEATLVEAVREGASDIHIYPNAEKKVEVHFRVDGRLHHWHTEDKVHPEAFLAVVKDNAMNVDRFERDKAQDGFIQRWVDNALIRFRVSVMPIANASQEIRSESIVIRVLDDRKVITDLSKLGLLEGALEKFEHAISQPNGMVILTGPTGSGKSTTLVASLHSVISPEVNVLTIEDPVEYIIPDVRQIKLSHKLQLEDALRAILRHDPDVVMVGEMRDRHTAELAIKLANTGHLTFSTLHTNDAPSAISRLYKMGIEPFLIAYAINLVVAQRLIRTLCPTCKRVDDDPDPVMLKKLGFTEEEIETLPIYMRGDDKHCKTCNGFGFKGRRAVSEALYFSREIRHMIVEADRMIDEGKIRDQAASEGMLSLQDSAREIVKMGETSIREMIRVVTSEA